MPKVMTLSVMTILLWLLIATCDAIPSKPSIILFMADDLGYGDLSSYGHPTQEFGAVDRMAIEGIRFTQFYTPHTLCTPSRTAMLTGRYAPRVGMVGTAPILLPNSQAGLPHSEITIAEILQQQGYSTGIVGKWHQGINRYNYSDGAYLPHTQGFSYVGHILPYSLVWRCDTYKRHMPHASTRYSFLYKNTTIVQQPIHLDNLTATLLYDAKAFIYNHQEKPFFFYFSFPQTHTPMFGSNRFRGKSRRGIYGDQINEMTWAIGEIIDLLKSLSLTEKTLVMFMSDHGPHREICAEGGTSGSLKGGKANHFEGGVRIPAIAWWPGTIKPQQISTSVLSITDILPTFTELSGGRLPNDRILDGTSFVDVLLSPSIESRPRDIIYFYCQDIIMAVRYREYKIHFRKFETTLEEVQKVNCDGFIPLEDVYIEIDHCNKSIVLNPPVIHNLHVDPSEEFSLDVEKYKYILDEVSVLKDKHMKDLVISERLLEESRMSTSLYPCCNPPYCACPVNEM